MILKIEVKPEPVGLTCHPLLCQSPPLPDDETALGLSDEGNTVFRITLLLVPIDYIQILVHPAGQTSNRVRLILVKDHQITLVLNRILSAHRSVLEPSPEIGESKDGIFTRQGWRFLLNHRIRFGSGRNR